MHVVLAIDNLVFATIEINIGIYSSSAENTAYRCYLIETKMKRGVFVESFHLVLVQCT